MAQLHNNRLRLIVDGLARLAQNGSDLLDAPVVRRRPVRRAARTAVERLARPLTVRQLAFDRQLVGGIEELSLGLETAHRGVSSFPAALDLGAVTDVAVPFGRLFLHPGDFPATQAIRWSGVWARDEAAFVSARLHEGQTFVDASAGSGYLAVLAAGLVGAAGRVIALEADPSKAELLRANLWRNGAGNAVVLPVLAHRRAELMPLRMDPARPTEAEVGFGQGARLLVPCARLDDLLDSARVDLIRIDAAGGDRDVQAGLAGLMRRAASPQLLCRFNPERLIGRGVDPRIVLRGYDDLGLSAALVDDAGRSMPADHGAIIARATSGPVWLHLVRTRR